MKNIIKHSKTIFIILECILLITQCAIPQTVISTVQYHSLPQNYYLEQRITSTIFASEGNQHDGRILATNPVDGNFTIYIENTNNTSYMFNLLTFPSQAPQSVQAYMCYSRAAIEGFKVHECPFTNITIMDDGNCTQCLQTALYNLKQTSACLGCSTASQRMNISLYQKLNNSSQNVELLQQNQQNSDVLLIIDNTNVIYPSGGVYLAMQIGYSINLTKEEDGLNMIFLWIIIIVVFILITSGLIAYLCFKIRKFQQEKVKVEEKQS